MSRAALLLALLLAGCTTAGDAVTGTLHASHDLRLGPRDMPFRVRDAVDALHARLAMEPLDGCDVREPTRAALLDPHGREALALPAPPDCRGEAHDPALPATPGTWTLRLTGNATLLASVSIRELEYPEGRGYVRTR